MGVLASEVGHRLRDLRKEANLNQAGLAQRAGLSASQVSRLESGAQWGGEETLLALFTALGQALGQPARAVQQRVLAGAALAKDSQDDGFVQVPMFTPGEMPTGGTMLKEGRPPQTHVGISKTVAGRDVAPQDMVLVTVVGDAMSPTLSPGDVALADQGRSQAGEDAMYLLRSGQGLLVRRLQRLPGNKLRVSCDNQAYGGFDLDPTDPGADMEPIGRIVWVSKRV